MKTELLNCLTEAHFALAEKNSATFDRIHAAVAAGLFAVVAEGEYRCASTDAIVGTAYEMEAFRASGLPNDAFSDWKQARNSEAAYERSVSDRMSPEPFF